MTPWIHVKFADGTHEERPLRWLPAHLRQQAATVARLAAELAEDDPREALELGRLAERIEGRVQAIEAERDALANRGLAERAYRSRGGLRRQEKARARRQPAIDAVYAAAVEFIEQHGLTPSGRVKRGGKDAIRRAAEADVGQSAWDLEDPYVDEAIYAAKQKTLAAS